MEAESELGPRFLDLRATMFSGFRISFIVLFLFPSLPISLPPSFPLFLVWNFKVSVRNDPKSRNQL